MQMLLGWTILILGIAAIIWILRRPKKWSNPTPGPSYAIVNSDQIEIHPYPYIYVNTDGTARELHPNERTYLETPFHPADGGRPYIKGRFSCKDGWGDIKGFLKRSKLPPTITVGPAPIEDPTGPLSKEDQMQFLRDKGLEVIENIDGTFTARKPKR
jgi:hypothetical protein